MRPLLWGILALALLLRLGYAASQPSSVQALTPLPDQLEYLELGQNLLTGNGLHMADHHFGGAPLYAYRTPGYPLLIAACGARIPLIRIVQSLLDTTTVLAVMLITLRLTAQSTFATAIAGILAALCPWLLYFSALLLSETLFTALLAWGTYLLLTRRLFWPGVLLLALSVLVRPGALALPVLLATLASFTRPRLQVLPVPLLAAGLVALVLLPWAYRNHVVLNEWVFTSTNEGITRYDGFNPAADANWGASDQSFLPHLRELSSMTETQRNHYLLQLADEAQHNRSHAGRSAELAAKKIARTWSPVPLSTENRSPTKWALGLSYSVIAWCLALFGLFRGWVTPGKAGKLLLLCPAIYLTVAAALSVGSLRYRVPAEPMLCVLAGVGALAALRPVSRPLAMQPAATLSAAEVPSPT
jgi:hypothetical protein